MKSTTLPTHACITFIAPDERLRPLRDVIVVKPIPPVFSETIEADWRGKPVRGTVVAAGPGTWPYKHSRGDKDGKRFHTVRESSQFRPTEVKAGDLVQLGGLEKDGYDFQSVIIDGVECVLATEKDICGIEA
jgi:co-chaperonin GroES (HSP10)